MVEVHRHSCCTACGIFPDQGSNPCSRIGRQILIHCATREVLSNVLDIDVLFFLEFKVCTPFVKFIPKDFIIFAATVNEIIFLILFSNYSFLVYRNTNDFWYIDLISCDFNLLVLVIFQWIPWDFLYVRSISSTNTVLLLSFQFGCLLFGVFFCQIALDRTLNIVLNRSGESGFCLLVPNLEGGELSVFTIKYDNSCGFLVDALYLVEEVPFYS